MKQQPTVVAFQGIAGSFSHIAARTFFSSLSGGIEPLGTQRFVEIFRAVSEGRAAYGVVPIENSIAGSVHENYDLLAEHDVHVIGEFFLHVEHHLMARAIEGKTSAARLNEVRRIFSHPKALEQCTKFFEAHPQIEYAVASDTAGAARAVAESGELTHGAIASAEAAQLYGLQVLQRNIEDSKYNYTRFLIIAPAARASDGTGKCSVIFSLPHAPASLWRTLDVLAKNALNLTKIESRPILGKPFEYRFAIDFEYPPARAAEIPEVLVNLRALTVGLKVLGCYPAAQAIESVG